MKTKILFILIFSLQFRNGYTRLSFEMIELIPYNDSIGISKNYANIYSDTFCFFEMKTLYALFDSTKKYNKIQWYRNDTLIAKAKEKTYQTNENGIYYFSIFNNEKLLLKSKPKTLYPPRKAIAKSSDNIRTLCQGELLALRSYPPLQKKYVWFYKDSFVTNYFALETKKTGTYHTTVEMQNGCKDYDSIQILPKGIWTSIEHNHLSPKINEKVVLKIHLKNFSLHTRYHIPLHIEIPKDFDILEMSSVFFQKQKSNTYVYRIDSIRSYTKDIKNELMIPISLLNKNECQKSIKITILDTSCYYPILDSIIFHRDTNTNVCVKRDDSKLCTHTSAWIQSTVRSNSNKIVYQWYKDSTALTSQTDATLKTEKEGNYSLKIISNSCPFVSNTLSIKIFKPLDVHSVIKDNLCLGHSKGSIMLTPKGGQAPYQFLWNNNSITSTLNNIPEGKYSVSILDKNNCKIAKDFEVKNKKKLDLKSQILSPINENGLYSIQFETDTIAKAPFIIQEISKKMYFSSRELYNISKEYNQFQLIDSEGCRSNTLIISK